MKYLLIALVAALCTGGCTHTEVLTLEPDFNRGLHTANQLIMIEPVLFSAGTFSDVRKDTTTLATFRESSNIYYLHSERLISEILFDGISALVLGAGHKWAFNDVGDVTLKLELLSVHAVRSADFVSITATADIIIKVDFIDNISGEEFYSGIYTGTDERDQVLFATFELVREAIDAAIVDCINDIGNDRNLAVALKRREQ